MKVKYLQVSQLTMREAFTGETIVYPLQPVARLLVIPKALPST
jgi:hypothetical protein